MSNTYCITSLFRYHFPWIPKNSTFQLSTNLFCDKLLYITILYNTFCIASLLMKNIMFLWFLRTPHSNFLQSCFAVSYIYYIVKSTSILPYIIHATLLYYGLKNSLNTLLKFGCNIIFFEYSILEKYDSILHFTFPNCIGNG